VIGATQPITTPSVDLWGIAPIMALVGAGVGVVLVRALMRRHRAVTWSCFTLSIVGVLVAGGLLFRQWHLVRDDGPLTTFAGMVRVDPFAVFLGVVITSATALALLLSVAYLRREGLEAPEYFALVLLSGAGMLMMTTANDLVVVFVSLEVLSIPLYVLAAFDRRRLGSQEAGLKYFILGAFSSAVFLYGVALVYGATGTTSLTGIAKFLSDNALFEQSTLLFGLGLLIVGLGFKVSAVPFHMWTPDVYQGSVAAAVHDGVPAVPGRLAADRVRARGAVAARGQHRRRRAERRETDPRLLVDRARGLHPHGRLRGHRARA
jgi:NADH-quinone oxidoreductase subunit N